MISFVDRFVMGAFTPFRGLGLLMSSRRLKLLSIIPFFLTVCVFIVGLAVALPWITGIVPQWTAWFIGDEGITVKSTWLTVLSWVIPILIWPVIVLALLYALFLVARVVAAPFYALLAERVLVEQKAITDVPFRLVPWLKVSVRMLIVSIGRALVFGPIGFLLFALSFVPGLGVVTGICFLILVAFDLCDYALESLQMSLKDRILFFRSHFTVFVGFGAVLGLVFLIPGLNFFLFPISIVGASDLVRRLLLPR